MDDPSSILHRNPVHVVLDNIRSAFNVGSIFRTADAGAAEHIHCCGLTACPPNRKLEKTALGATSSVPWTHHETAEDAIARLRALSVPVTAVEVAPGAIPHTAFDWPRPAAILFGHEVTGVRPELLRLCDGVVFIPMMGVKQSINVATAFGIVLYEILRRWNALPASGGGA